MGRITVGNALREGRELLERGAVAAPRLTAEVLLSHALGKPKSYLYGHGEDELSELAWIHYGRYLHERLKGKPTQYITQTQEFYGRPFRVGPAVLIPRPETEHVIEVALERARGAKRALDIGTGSGAIGITWERETNCATVASDISVAALEVAQRNARALGSAVSFAAGDLGSAFSDGSFDLVLANPPYIPDPEGAALQRDFKGVSLDDHRRWQQQIRAVTGSFALGGIAIFLLVAAATTAVIVSATKSAMASNRDIVEVLHFVGATDKFIAREFEKHFLRLGIKAGIVGAVAAMAVFLTMPAIMEMLGGGAVSAVEMQRLIGTGSLDPAGYALLGLVVVIIAGLCMITSRVGVFRILNGQH